MNLIIYQQLFGVFEVEEKLREEKFDYRWSRCAIKISEVAVASTPLRAGPGMQCRLS
jgi:hypothetical protein